MPAVSEVGSRRRNEVDSSSALVVRFTAGQDHVLMLDDAGSKVLRRGRSEDGMQVPIFILVMIGEDLAA